MVNEYCTRRTGRGIVHHFLQCSVVTPVPPREKRGMGGDRQRGGNARSCVTTFLRGRGGEQRRQLKVQGWGRFEAGAANKGQGERSSHGGGRETGIIEKIKKSVNFGEPRREGQRRKGQNKGKFASQFALPSVQKK